MPLATSRIKSRSQRPTRRNPRSPERCREEERLGPRPRRNPRWCRERGRAETGRRESVTREPHQETGERPCPGPLRRAKTTSPKSRKSGASRVSNSRGRSRNGAAPGSRTRWRGAIVGPRAVHGVQSGPAGAGLGAAGALVKRQLEGVGSSRHPTLGLGFRFEYGVGPGFAGAPGRRARLAGRLGTPPSWARPAWVRARASSAPPASGRAAGSSVSTGSPGNRTLYPAAGEHEDMPAEPDSPPAGPENCAQPASSRITPTTVPMGIPFG